jgi:MtN3 and saliva related transmembrane protein
MTLIDFVGLVAAVLTTTSFVPQAWHTFRTRDVRGISLGMYSAFTAGVTCWLIYGLLLRAWPIVLANCITVTLAGMILVMKLRFR